MKKLIIMFALIIYLLGVVNVCADNSTNLETRTLLIELNILDEMHFSNPNIVTRQECLIAIMRVIGVTDEEINSIRGAGLYAFADTPSFSYFGCSYLSKIAYGVECVVDYPTYRTEHTRKNVDFFFFPERAVTVKETLAFMVRCLEQSDDKSVKYAMERAEEYGLINYEDTFIDKCDSDLSQDDFYVLLERFLHQKRYKYYDRLNNRFKMEGYVDEEQSMTYLEFLTQRQI